MEESRREEIVKIAIQRIQRATSHIEQSKNPEELKKAINEEAEIPGFEKRPMKFGQFINKEFVVMMTDIRRSTDIINAENGLVNMFKIFYAYSAVVANIVDYNQGTSTEFLGDGVLNLFDIESKDRDDAFRHAIQASRDILFARENVLNPVFTHFDLPNINIGIGIDHGITIVTRFGHNMDNDLKAFGKCAYNVSRLCKGVNTILGSPDAQLNWPKATNGTLQFTPAYDVDRKLVYQIT